MKQYLPILNWLPNYNKKYFANDLVAGLTVGVMLVPQGMAYALLAGMPPVYGLYAGLIPLVIYAIMGTSMQLSPGPVAVSALLVLSGVNQLATPQTAEYIELVILAGFFIGLFKVIMRMVKVGFLVNFLSKPVIAGFTSAAAIIIGLSQLKYLLGIEVPRFQTQYEIILHIGKHIQETHILTAIICLTGIALILLLKKWNKLIPGALIVLIISTLVVRIFHLDQYGIDIVGVVPQGLPSFQVPNFDIEKIRLLIPTILTVGIIGVVEGISIAKVLEAQNKDHEIDADQEILAFGFAKIFGSFFQAIPISASFTRSAVNSETGAKTPMSLIFTASVIALTLMFFTDLFYYLPKAILASIILVSIKSLFDINMFKKLKVIHKQDLWMMMITFIATLLIGISYGVATGVVLSILMVLYRSSKPQISILGRIPNTEHYKRIDRFDNLEISKKYNIMRFDAPLFYGNVASFKKAYQKYTDEKDILIIDASSITDIDSSGIYAFEELMDFGKEKNIRIKIVGVLGEIRDMLAKSNFYENHGTDFFFMTIAEAVEYIDNNNHSDFLTQIATQV